MDSDFECLAAMHDLHRHAGLYAGLSSTGTVEVNNGLIGYAPRCCLPWCRLPNLSDDSRPPTCVIRRSSLGGALLVPCNLIKKTYCPSYAAPLNANYGDAHEPRVTTTCCCGVCSGAGVGRAILCSPP